MYLFYSLEITVRSRGSIHTNSVSKYVTQQAVRNTQYTALSKQYVVCKQYASIES